MIPAPEITLLSVLFLIGAAQGYFFAFALFTSKLTDNSASRYLAFLLVIFSSELFCEFLDHTQYGLQYFRLMIFLFPIDFLFGPLIWLYTSKMCSRDGEDRGPLVFLHFVPTLIYAPYIWSLMFLPLTGDPDFFIDNPVLLQPNQIQPWIAPPLTQLPAILHIAIYLLVSLWRLRRHAIAIENVYSYHEGVALLWLRRLLLAFVVLLVLFAVRVGVAAEMHSFVNVADIILNSGIVLVIYSMAYCAARQPRIFTQQIEKHRGYDNRSSEAATPVLTEVSEVDVSPPKDDPVGRTDKYRKSALDEEASSRILKRLEQIMEAEKPYLKNNLILPDLAKMIATTPNYLSQVINEQLQMNFFDLVNSYRIEAAKELLINPLPHTRTILDVAMESAFNSKSAFYTAFKKQTGLTPVEFKKAQSG